jgi:excisionase family DNA binding protein
MRSDIDSAALARRTYDVDEAGRLLGLGRGAAYEAARRGDIPTIRIGRRVLVPRAALDRLIDGDPTGR